MSLITRGWWGRLGLLVATVVLSVVYVTPTLTGLDPEKSKFPFKQKINLGLDLQGGLYLVLGVDFNKVFKDVLDRQRGSLESRLVEKNLHPAGSGFAKVLTEGFPADDARVVVEFDAAKKTAIYDLLKKEFWTLRVAGEAAGRYELGLSREYRQEVRDRTISQSIEVIRNRIDEFGVSEPVIASQGTDRLVVELPGVKEVDRAKDLIGRTAKLEFKIVNDEALNPGQLSSRARPPARRGT
jgi:preprotein translocase subunit SecD